MNTQPLASTAAVKAFTLIWSQILYSMKISCTFDSAFEYGP